MWRERGGGVGGDGATVCVGWMMIRDLTVAGSYRSEKTWSGPVKRQYD